MSDWGPERTPNPSIILDFLWQEQPVAYCGNCSDQVNLHARSHWGGCNIVYKFVTTRAMDAEWQQKARDLRPDLEYVAENVHLPEHEVEYLNKQPIRPMFAWEKGEQIGEGRAGNYLAELKRNPPTFKANNYLVQAAAAAGMEVPEFMAMPKGFRFPFYYGGGFTGRMTSIKEAPMQQKYNLTVEVTDLLVLSKVIQAIDGGVYGALVEAVEPAPEPVKVNFEDIEVDIVQRYGDPQATLERVVKVDTASIVRYLEDVCARNASIPESEIDVTVVYVAAGTEERSTRNVTPIRVQGNVLTLLDGEKGIKTFLISRIERVEGPAV